MQADQSDHMPVFMSHVRLREPQLPHPIERSPSQLCPVQPALH
jgi:hypothetical protein